MSNDATTTHASRKEPNHNGNNTADADVPAQEAVAAQPKAIAPGATCILSGLTHRQDLNNQRCVVVRKRKGKRSKSSSSQTWEVKILANSKHIAVGAHRLIVVTDNTSLSQNNSVSPDQQNHDQSRTQTSTTTASDSMSTTATAATPSAPSRITVGSNCVFRGLRRRADLNGTSCVVLRRSAKNSETWVVQIVANQKCIEAAAKYLEVTKSIAPSSTSTGPTPHGPANNGRPGNIFLSLSSIIAAASGEQLKQWQQEVNILEDDDYEKRCPTQGISFPLLTDLCQFITDHHPDWSTYDFCEKYVKPITAQFQCSLLNLLNVVIPTTATVKHLSVISNQATIFVSHAWSYRNSRLLSCLIQLDNADNDFFWIDTLTVRQHETPSRPKRGFSSWCDTFQKSVELIGRTVLVLQPYSDPVPLKRSWCLFEIFCTHNAEKKVQFDIVLDREEKKAFTTAMMKNNFNMSDWVANIDLATARARDEQDQKNILARVNATAGGVQRLNEIVTEMLRDWLANAGRELVATTATDDDGPVSNESAMAQLQLAALLQQQGKLTEAEALCRRQLNQHRANLGDNHVMTLNVMTLLVCILNDQGKYSEAEPMGRNAVAGFEAHYGPTDDVTLVATNGLAIVLQKQQKISEAEELFRKVLRIRTAKLGAAHPHTLEVMQNLAISLDEQNKFGEAEVLFQTVLVGRKATLGEGHPSTLGTMCNFATLLSKQNKLADAEVLQRQVLAVRRAKLGRHHPDYFSALYNLATTLARQGKYEEAEALYREAVSGFQAKFGDNHVRTARAKEGLALTLTEQGRFVEAVQLYRQALAVKQSEFGPGHELTLQTVHNLNCAVALQKHAKAKLGHSVDSS